ncbi:hypothetical protein USDA257_c58000 [Sinorhizobium fredii USDA 257]|uniref:Uncharacterized protein n=1 Tax=Sinorhizobium fredii (strain USDA 257) TaxID=1185652 RepID=I3XEK5_SINF2|nr:hypothetical protein USDA257_c58000 [Sinorhizobium fredii USDA 257]
MEGGFPSGPFEIVMLPLTRKGPDLSQAFIEPAGGCGRAAALPPQSRANRSRRCSQSLQAADTAAKKCHFDASPGRDIQRAVGIAIFGPHVPASACFRGFPAPG